MKFRPQHPLLCAVKAYLAITNIKGLESYTKVGNIPTPYLFKNVPYLVEIDTQPIVDGKKVSIYGNAFSYYEYNDPEVLKGRLKLENIALFLTLLLWRHLLPSMGVMIKILYWRCSRQLFLLLRARNVCRKIKQ